jgi:hypothetical protein
MDTLLTDCLEWTGAKSKDGYGQRRIDGKVHYVHRLSFESFHGRKPVGVIRHKCDNRACYNPEHLVEGTKKQNSQDMVERDRHTRGERHINSKLRASQVLEIKEAYDLRGETQKQIADRYGISDRTVRDIGTGRRWTDPRNFR